MGILSTIIGALDPVSRVVDGITKAKIASANATTDREKIAADERVKTLELKRDVLVAEAGSKIHARMRAYGLAMPVAIVLWKIFVWDKALGQWTRGRTDPLSPELWQVIMAVVGFYFLAETGSSIARALAARGK